MFTAQPRPTSMGRPETISGAAKRHLLGGNAAKLYGFRPRVSSRRGTVIRAVISSTGDSKAGVETAKKLADTNGSVISSSSSRSSGGGDITVRAVITIRKKMKEKLFEKIEDGWESFINGIGRGILIQLISQDIDPAGNYIHTTIFQLFTIISTTLFIYCDCSVFINY